MTFTGQALLSHIAAFIELSPTEHDTIKSACSRQVRKLGARQDIIREGENPRVVNVLLSGWAMRYKQLADGRRQILSFFIPGDLCDANVFVLRKMDHSVGALTPITYAVISQHEFESMLEASPRISKALWWSELVTMAIQREWTTNIGQRSAIERIAHLFCEMYFRLKVVGLVENDSYTFPLTQIDIADATGMTPVHVNRTLQRLRSEGLIELDNKKLYLPDLARLISTAQFNPGYLHLDELTHIHR